ncbi:MAG: hypothetical protein JEZ11_17190 [Desulfobacterales bacterium]|nr:hypothetical protein [Desulfobacterales bacterium]
MKKAPAIFWVTIFFFFALAIPALAAMVERPADLPAMTAQSDLILRARVRETDARWRADDAGRHIYTTVRFETLSTLKGRGPADRFEMEVIGGTVDGLTETVTDSAAFKAGEEAILFLQTNPLRLYNGRQGKIPITRDTVFFERKKVPAADFLRGLERTIAVPGKKMRIIKGGSPLSDNHFVPPGIKTRQDRKAP